VPMFRAQNYAGGIIAGIDAVLKVINQEPLPESTRKKGSNQGSEVNSILMFAITLAVFGLMAFASTANRRRNNMWATRGRHHGPTIFGGPGGFGGGGLGGGSGGGFSGGGGGFGGGGASSSW
jgi:uncharacterized protein